MATANQESDLNKKKAALLEQSRRLRADLTGDVRHLQLLTQAAQSKVLRSLKILPLGALAVGGLFLLPRRRQPPAPLAVNPHQLHRVGWFRRVLQLWRTYQKFAPLVSVVWAQTAKAANRRRGEN